MAPTTPRQRRSGARVKGLLAVALLAPLVVFIAALGTRFGVWDWRVGHDLLTLRIGWPLALAGGVAALAAAVFALGDLRRSAVFAILAVVAAGATLAGFVRQTEWGAPWAVGPDVGTDQAEPPGYSDRILAARTAAQAVPVDLWRGQPDGCRLGGSIPTQVAPQTAALALERAGFRVIGAGVGRAEGVHEGFWFGFTHDAVIRIRPGQTDVRVTAREDRFEDGHDQGEACRLARAILVGLQAGR